MTATQADNPASANQHLLAGSTWLNLSPRPWLQVFSSTSVGEGAGVYWMFYSGGTYESGPLPTSLPGAAAACEGARHALGPCFTFVS